MFNLVARSVKLGRTVHRIFNGGLATAAPRIGDTKVEMSPLEQGNFVNYQRIEDNLTVVRSRFVDAVGYRLISYILDLCSG